MGLAFWLLAKPKYFLWHPLLERHLSVPQHMTLPQSPTTDWEETLLTPSRQLKLLPKSHQKSHTKPSQSLNTPMSTNQLPSEPSNQPQSSQKHSKLAQSLPNNPFSEPSP